MFVVAVDLQLWPKNFCHPLALHMLIGIVSENLWNIVYDVNSLFPPIDHQHHTDDGNHSLTQMYLNAPEKCRTKRFALLTHE